MSDPLCVGVCMIDWDTGVCIGCGRTSDEIDGVPVATPAEDTKPKDPPLPPNVAREVGEGTE